MRACVQRVSRAEVSIAGEVVGRIGRGLLVLLGVAAEDGPADVEYLADKICGLRVFEDAEGKMNRALLDLGGADGPANDPPGAMLIVSQFTLLGDCRRGRRPGFSDAAPPERAVPLYEAFVEAVRARGIVAETGRFREHMEVSLVNDGPVTLLLDSRKLF